MTSTTSPRGPYGKTLVAMDVVYAGIVERATSRGRLELDQKTLAQELGIQYTAVQRAVKHLLESGRIAQIGKGAHGAKRIVLTYSE